MHHPAARSQPGPAPREEPAQHRGAQRSAQVVPALGPVQTAHRECAPGSAGFGHVDAFLWVHPPGNSSGTCRGGTPSGTFWLHRALVEAANANGRLGPGHASDSY